MQEAFARKIAQRIPKNYFTETPLQNNNPRARPLEAFPISDRQIKNHFEIKDEKNIPALYIYNYVEGGFVVLSAETKHEPICAYVPNSLVDEKDSVPGSLIEWFGKTVENIQFVREGSYDNTERAAAAWRKLIKETDLTNYPEIARPVLPPPPPPNCDESPWSTNIAGPLLTTTWGQGCSYNDLCPEMNCTNICWGTANAWTGCVATAMSQVIRYWEPDNFYNYHYDLMPNGEGNGEVQRLMRDAGENLNMDYGCEGSSARADIVPIALRNIYGLNTATYSNYALSSYAIVQSDLTKGQPVLLDGCVSKKKVWLVFNKYSSCHEWVCDGFRHSYNSCYSYLYFHMNWGWHETWITNDFNGWYTFNNWNPGSANFQYARGITHNIHP